MVFSNRVGVIDCVLTNASILAQPCDRLVGRGGLELGDGLGALGDGVLGCVDNKFVILRYNINRLISTLFEHNSPGSMRRTEVWTIDISK